MAALFQQLLQIPKKTRQFILIARQPILQRQFIGADIPGDFFGILGPLSDRRRKKGEWGGAAKEKMEKLMVIIFPEVEETLAKGYFRRQVAVFSYLAVQPVECSHKFF